MKTPNVAPPDPTEVLAGLKDFQRQTVEHVFRRLYLDERPTRRFLVADEVGLGKTLVARGLIARAIEYLWDKIDRIDVVYVCSNAAIARQNMARLNLSSWLASHLGLDPGDVKFAHATRVTLLPLVLKNLRAHKVNFVSLTPATSFELSTSLGTGRERALLYLLLREAWGFGSGVAPYHVLQGYIKKRSRFRAKVEKIESDGGFDDDLGALFAKELATRPDLEKRFSALCEAFPRQNSRPPLEVLEERKAVIGELRSLLARTCLDALEPDLVILDEFQRFKDLFNPELPAGHLASDFFDYDRDEVKSRVVLLSATPYKMYTVSQEDEDHYKDFLDTLRFLQDDPEATAAFAELLGEYRREILRIGSGQLERLRTLRDQIETRLRAVVCRTERISAGGDPSAMLEETTVGSAPLRTSDLLAFATLDRVAQDAGASGVLEYWKSAPYLLNFMRDYTFKRDVMSALESSDRHRTIAGHLGGSNGVLLPGDALEGYLSVDPSNPRLRWLMDDIARSRSWKLLWLPASLPYYEDGPPFDGARKRSVTKRLIFSAWRVVPRAISTLVSYEVERRMMRAYHRDPQSTAEARRRFAPPLRFSLNEGRPGGMTAFGLVYPSVTLARELDPLRLRDGDVKAVRARARARCEELLAPILAGAGSEGGVDPRWYWAAPILLDARAHPEATRAWLGDDSLADRWYETRDADETAGHHDAWDAHVELARAVAGGADRLGPAPRDLAEVVTELALAGPGTAALRALSRGDGDEALMDADVRVAAGQIGLGFISLFNRREAVALLRSLTGSSADSPYWRQALAYGVSGNLQAVMDEYAHVLRGSLGPGSRSSGSRALELAARMRQALELRAANPQVDDIRVQGGRVSTDSRRLFARFAARFGDDESETTSRVDREEQVRDAFNSPFWPFVLATTSVGQEGLDFHPYCHAVVHWNLPSNPVDLEQREGRVHRFKGHAIRKNVAAAYRDEVALDAGRDPWDQLFQRAADARPSDSTDLIPFWLFPEGEARIERHVPAMALSRDLDQLVRLRKTLAVYRMVFGQARQEDLVRFLLEHVDAEQHREVLDSLTLDLRPGYTIM